MNKAGSTLMNIVIRIAGDKYKDFITLYFAWKEIVGRILAQYSHVHKIENKTIFIAVSNNVWLQELILKKQYILEKIEQITPGIIREIVFFMRAENDKNIPVSTNSKFSSFRRRTRKH